MELRNNGISEFHLNRIAILLQIVFTNIGFQLRFMHQTADNLNYSEYYIKQNNTDTFGELANKIRNA